MRRRDFLTSCASAAAAPAQQIGDLVRLERPDLAGPAHRAVMGRNGVVATADQHGSLAGMRMLLKGGNAVDAIVAAAATLNVTEPYMSGMGGFGGFLLMYVAKEKKVVALDMMGTSPAAATIERFTERDCDEGYLAPIVPGSLLGWSAALERYGTMKLAEVFEPAIDLAENGFVVTRFDALSFAATAEKLARYPTTARVLLPKGRPPRAGEILYQKDLGRSFRRVAAGGPELFYRGELARQVVSFLRERGGILSQEDMAGFRVRWREPIRASFAGHTIYAMPPGSCGMTMLQILNVMEAFDLPKLDPYSVEFAHRWIEAVKLAFLDDDRYNTGKEVEIPVARLISKEYAAEQRGRIDARKVAAFAGPRLPWEGTTSLAAADRWGNVVAFTQSLVSGFGSGVVVGDTGILLNNGHRYGFVLERSHVNSLVGGQRAKGVMSPVLVFRGDRPVLGIGAAGGYTIPQTVGQAIVKFLLYGMDVQQAIASPRMLVNRGAGRVPVGNEAQTYLEAGFPEAARAGLARLGHRLAPPGNAGGVQGVAVDPETGALSGGADPRRDGHAMAW